MMRWCKLDWGFSFSGVWVRCAHLNEPRRRKDTEVGRGLAEARFVFHEWARMDTNMGFGAQNVGSPDSYRDHLVLTTEARRVGCGSLKLTFCPRMTRMDTNKVGFSSLTWI